MKQVSRCGYMRPSTRQFQPKEDHEMSLESKIEELLKSNSALEAALAANTAILERVVEGQQTAIEKLEGAKASGGRGRSRTKPAEDKPAEDKPAEDKPANEAKKDKPAEAASTARGADDAGAAASSSPVAAIAKKIGTDVDKMKQFIADWTGETDDKEEREARVDLLKGMAQHFGGKGYSALVTSAETASQAIFFVERARALGVSAIDFKADYDFDGDPAQGGDAETSSDDDFD
ncbi:hypothetical protein I5E68_09675 [Novosphingobium sp. YJ-S2-02]|uniref:Uncharacterized protein n=1 Tax=Novosphingobium aureum TaxID=2792964 RepID=A0A931ML81_9SPHN|nr:hypothetical protein [Novosphingobium aureum]MBH0113214.1 hypothetical protein [Novosphingobium aureum]